VQKIHLVPKTAQSKIRFGEAYMKVSGQESRQDSSDVFRDLDRSTAHVLRALEDFPMTDVFFPIFSRNSAWKRSQQDVHIVH
jgi:hypothetical protein